MYDPLLLWNIDENAYETELEWLSENAACAIENLSEKTIRRLINARISPHLRDFVFEPKSPRVLRDAYDYYSPIPTDVDRLVETETHPDFRRIRSPLVGREGEQQLLRELMIPSGEVRLVSVVGPAGIGKTRLSLQIASELESIFFDGAFVVDLTTARGDYVVEETIEWNLSGKRCAQLRPFGAVPLNSGVISIIKNRQLLLVIDGIEDTLSTNAIIRSLLDSCPNLSVMVCHRTPLGLPDEHVVTIAPLSYSPDLSLGKNEVGDRDCPAVRFFEQRMRLVRPLFELSETNSAKVLSLCELAGGNPLAIELVTSRCDTPEFGEIADQLSAAARVRSHESDSDPDLRRVIQWSYGLLSGDEQQFLRGLSVFAGGFEKEAVVSVFDQVNPSSAPSSIDSAIDTLLRVSLLRRISDKINQPRYMLHPAIREFAADLLSSTGEAGQFRRAHADYYSRLGTRLEPQRLGVKEKFSDRIRRLDSEIPNLRVALDELRVSGEFESLLRLTGSTATLWFFLNYFREAENWLERSLQYSSEGRSEDRCRAVWGLGLIYWARDDRPNADKFARQSLDLALSLNHVELIAFSFHLLGLTVFADGDPDAARMLMEEARDRRYGFEHPTSTVTSVMCLSSAAYEYEDDVPNQAVSNAALHIMRSSGLKSHSAWLAALDGRREEQAGREKSATRRYLRCLAHWLDLLDFRTAAWNRRITEAGAPFPWWVNRDDRRTVTAALVGMSVIAESQGHLEMCAYLSGAVSERIPLTGSWGALAFRHQLTPALTRASDSLGMDSFATHFESGRSERLAVVIEKALDFAGLIKPSSAADQKEFKILDRYPGKRNKELLRRMSEGQTDAEIAEALGIDPEKIEKVINRMVRRMTFSSREVAIAYSTRHRYC